MELRILLFMTTISFATGQVTMAISKRKITLGSLVELVCAQPGQGWRCDWHRDGEPALTVRKTSQTPCGVDWYIDYPANTKVICQANSGRFLLRFQKSTIELNGTIWDCKIDGSFGSNSVTISLTKEWEKKDTTTAEPIITHTHKDIVYVTIGCFLLIIASAGVIIICRKHGRTRQSETRTLTYSHNGKAGRTTDSLVMQENDLYESSKEHGRVATKHTTEIYTEIELE
ncbi:uncharacterized protein [Haliotis asinina]|uniref:uncharacterized protein isoform X2 n=1 Tax=Haliotis asinina TaxID=109174 RepID=UPI0035322ADC